MEATAALGIAGNVVQFLEFGQKLCRTFSQIHRSATGVTEHNNDTEILIHSFASNVGVISGDLAKYCAHLGATKGPDGGMNSGQGGDQMQAVIRGCGEVAVDLLGRLDKLKSCSGLPVGKRKAILTTVKAMWKGKELEDLELKLSRFRKELQWIVVVSLRRSLDLLESRQKDQFEILQTSMSDILTRLIQVNMTPLPAWPTAASLASPSLQPGVHERLGNSYASGLAEVEELALKSLAFPVMPHRETEIADAEAATFDWIFAEPQHRDRSWSNFSEWLTGDNSARLYWINGKAGSGKSTLMKYLVRHAKTKAALQAWAGSTKLLLASFFFWHNGHEIQRSQIGLIRSLLYACLKNHRELIPVVLSGTEALDANDLSDYWNLPKLREALERLVSQTRFDLKFVFFVDGLDEYAGTHGEIADILKRISLRGNVKVCVSSRPLLVFDHAFDGLPHLVLQNLTFNDITFYVNNKLGDNERMKTLEKYEPGLRASLTDAIVRKASGVFLWVHLVVKSLLDGLGNYDVGDDLRRRLDDLPEELEALYWLMIQKVKPAWYLEEGFRLLRMVKASTDGVTLLRLYFAEMSKNASSLPENCAIRESWDQQDILARDIAGRVKSRCLGLLETDPDPGPGFYGAFRNVSFIHKSVSDFLDTEAAQSRILACRGQTHFVPEVALLRGCLLELKGLEIWVTDPLSSNAWQDHVVPLVYDFMNIARTAEKATGSPNTALIQAFRSTVDGLWWRGRQPSDGYWTLGQHLGNSWGAGRERAYKIPEIKRLPNGIKTFEELCVRFGLDLYVAETTSSPRTTRPSGAPQEISRGLQCLGAAEVISAAASVHTTNAANGRILEGFSKAASNHFERDRSRKSVFEWRERV